MGTTAIGSTANVVGRFLPYVYKDLRTSFLEDCLQRISKQTQKEGFYAFVAARFHVFTLPVCAAGSLLQVSGRTLSHVLSKTCSGTEKEYDVEHDKKVLKEISLKKDCWELAAHIVATVAIIFAYLPGIFFAGIFQCDLLLDLPKSEEEEQIAKPGAWENEKQTLEKKSLLDQLALHHPLTPATYDQWQKHRSFFEPLGISFHRYEGEDYERKSNNDEDEDYKYVQSTWGINEGFLTQETIYEKTQMTEEYKKLFLKPPGSIELTVDCTKMDPDILTNFVQKEHQFHRLKLIGADLETLKQEPYSKLLSKIHTLVLVPEEGKELVYSSQTLCELSDQCKNIAAFDLSQCTFDEGKPLEPLIKLPEGDRESFGTARIVIYPKFKKNSVSFEKDNINEMVSSLNHYLHDCMNRSLTDNNNAIRQAFLDYQKNLFHPAAPFMTKVAFLKGSRITSKDLSILLNRFPPIFPHLEILDLRDCAMLTSKALRSLNKLANKVKFKELSLDGCDVIFYRDPAEEKKKANSQKQPERPDYTKLVGEEQKNYILNMSDVTRTIVGLFNQGVQTINIDQVGLTHQCWSEIDKAFRYGINPGIKESNAQCRNGSILYGDEKAFPKEAD